MSPGLLLRFLAIFSPPWTVLFYASPELHLHNPRGSPEAQKQPIGSLGRSRLMHRRLERTLAAIVHSIA